MANTTEIKLMTSNALRAVLGELAPAFERAHGCQIVATFGPAQRMHGDREALPEADRAQVRDVPAVVERLEKEAEALRARGQTGERLAETVAALENLRLAMLKLRAGSGTVADLTLWLERAREIGDYVDRRIAAEGEVKELLGG